MIFNIEKENNRNYIDMGDLESFLTKAALTNKELDKKTVASIFGLINYLTKVFNEKQPKSGTVYPVNIPDAFLNKELKRILKKNIKLDKKKDSSILGLDEEGEILLPVFTSEQLEQLQQLITSNNDVLRDIFVSSAKEIQPKVVISDPTPKSTKKTPA